MLLNFRLIKDYKKSLSVFKYWEFSNPGEGSKVLKYSMSLWHSLPVQWAERNSKDNGSDNAKFAQSPRCGMKLLQTNPKGPHDLPVSWGYYLTNDFPP